MGGKPSNRYATLNDMREATHTNTIYTKKAIQLYLQCSKYGFLYVQENHNPQWWFSERTITEGVICLNMAAGFQGPMGFLFWLGHR